VFLFRSQTERHGPKPLNAIATAAIPIEGAAERTARDLAMLRRMGELGMQLMERAAQALLQTEQEPQTREPDQKLAFTRLCQCVQRTLALEHRIAAKLPAAPAEDSPSATDPRRPMIKDFLLEQIDASPYPKSVKAGFRQQLDPLITEYLEQDLEQDHPGGFFVLEICKQLGLACTTSDMPDELLKRLHRTATPEEKAAVAADVHRRIYGRDPP